MAFTKRERWVGIGTVAAIALFGIDRFVVTPYETRMDELAKARETASGQLSDAALVFSNQRRAEKIWKALQEGGLEVNASQAESQALHSLLAWAEESGVTLTALKPERPTQEGSFDVISFDVTGNGSMRTISRMLWSLETARIPLRLNEVRIKPRKDDTDDLSVSVNVSALCEPPEPGKIQNASVSYPPVSGEGS